MAVFIGSVLSSSTNGRPIPVVATATPGTNIHTAGATGYEEVYLWASNVSTAAVTLTVEWGGVSDPGDHLVKAYTLQPNSPPIPIAVGQRIAGGLSIKAFAGTTAVVNITGYANAVR